ncbi:MAG: glycosyltransferase [Vicinamibacterales bacterium]
MLHNESSRTGRRRPVVAAHAGAIAHATHAFPRRGATEEPRVLFYSHDSYGLGHIRRTLSLSEAVRSRYERAALLVLTGSSTISSLPMPAGLDWVKLPGVTKVDDGEYQSRHLPLAFDAVRSVRRDVIYSTARAYQPSLVFVDNVPLGLKGELRCTLETLRIWNPGVRVVLTLRDILDEPSRIIDEWRRDGTCDTIDRLYDDVVVYGAREVFDIVREYRLPASLAAKCHYAGYIRREPTGSVSQLRAQLAGDAERLVLVTVGGGGDGQPLVEHYLEGLEGAGPDGLGARVHSLVVCGPEMSAVARHRIRARHGHRRDVSIIDFTPDLVTTMAASDVVVGMGGYNTVCEVLSLAKPAVIMPRRHPRLEQWIRCTRMAELGLMRVVHPEQDPAPSLIREVRAALSSPPPRTSFLNLAGLSTLDQLLPGFIRSPLG